MLKKRNRQSRPGRRGGLATLRHMAVRLKIWFFAGLLLAAHPAVGAERGVKDASPSISFGLFPLPLKRTYVFSEAGTPAAKAEMDTPFPNDFPPSTTVALEDVRKVPGGKGRYYFPSRNTVRVYRIPLTGKSPYKTIQNDLGILRKLLSERPSAVAENKDSSLPDYPPRNAAHCFEVKLSYLDAAWGSAVCYVTQFTQDGGTPANNEELTYLVQGLSKDGQFYLSADFHITHPKLPKTVQETPERKDDYAPDRALLSGQRDNSFTPALDKIRGWVAEFEIK